MQAEVDGLVVDVHGHPLEHLLGAGVGDGVGVGAGGAFGPEHDAGRVVVAGPHFGDAAVVDSFFGWGGSVVVLDEDAAVVTVDGLGGAVTKPDEIPVIAVWGEWGGFGRGGLEGLRTEGDVFELRAEVGVPVCVVFEDEARC